MQAGVDDLHAGVTKGSRDDLGPAVMSIETRLGDYYANPRAHRADILRTGALSAHLGTRALVATTTVTRAAIAQVAGHGITIELPVAHRPFRDLPNCPTRP
jgi:hypothetical protein